MKIFDEALRQIEYNKTKREKGEITCIPFGFTKFEEYIPGLQKKNYSIITASSGVGKSKLTKFMYVLQPYEFVKQNNYNVKLKIFYFCLEESKTNFIHSLIVYKLYKDYGIVCSIKQLKSIGVDDRNILTDDVLEKVKLVKEYFYELEETIEIIDDIRNPYGMFKKVSDYMEENGKWTYKTIDFDGEQKQVKDIYIPDNDDHYVMFVVDHISLLHPEKGMSLHEAINKLSSVHCIHLRDKYGVSPVIVQQQSADKEKQQYTYRGQSIESKLEPSLDGLGDNKLTQRDADEVIGLFAPDRYEIVDHRGYNIEELRDNYRSLLVLKNRDGNPNIRVGLFFNGACNYFEELPKSSEMTPQLYNHYKRKVNGS